MALFFAPISQHLLYCDRTVFTYPHAISTSIHLYWSLQAQEGGRENKSCFIIPLKGLTTRCATHVWLFSNIKCHALFHSFRKSLLSPKTKSPVKCQQRCTIMFIICSYRFCKPSSGLIGEMGGGGAEKGSGATALGVDLGMGRKWGQGVKKAAAAGSCPFTITNKKLSLPLCPDIQPCPYTAEASHMASICLSLFLAGRKEFSFESLATENKASQGSESKYPNVQNS